MDYAPLSARAVRRIQEFDRSRGFGPGGEMPNRNRFYIFLTQKGSDVQVRTVAVKAAKRTGEPVAKEVALASVDDPWIHIKDLGFYPMSGYVVDWTPEGFGRGTGWGYNGRWETEVYARRGPWKISVPVVNPELLKQTRRFRWAPWTPARGHLLDYLKVYKDHPQIELLAKAGLGRFSLNTGLLTRLETNEPFRRFFMKNMAEIKRSRMVNIPIIYKAFQSGMSLSEAWQEFEARRSFSGYGLPRSLSAVKALRYMGKHSVKMGDYTHHLKNCQALELDLADTKVSFPKQFRHRRQIVQEQADALRIKQNAKKCAKMNRQLAGIADKWSWLERKRGAYQLVVPRSEQEFSAEGKALASCLNERYAAKAASGEVLVVFVRQRNRPDEAFVAVEYNLKREVVTQCYGIKNGKPPKKVRQFVERAFSRQATARIKEAA